MAGPMSLCWGSRAIIPIATALYWPFVLCDGWPAALIANDSELEPASTTRETTIIFEPLSETPAIGRKGKYSNLA